MTNTTKRIATAIATGAVLLQALAPLTFADTQAGIISNGTGSNNTVNVNNTNTTSVGQSNTATVTNVVTSSSNSGSNTANANTGGNTTINAGAATSNVDVTNAANTNAATVNNCGCNGGSVTGLVSGNGAGSANGLNLNNNNTTSVGQTNKATISNYVTSSANSGENSANANTGGTTTVNSEGATSGVDVHNAANVNVANIGSAGAGAGMGGTTAMILDNGTGSQNSVNVNNNHSVALGQTNSSYITNLVDSSANSGGNSADANTGGNTTINAGSATAKAHITNLPNFNLATLADCGCATGGNLLKVAGNGAFSASAINANLNNTTSLSEGNLSELSNFVTPSANSGENSANANTGAVMLGGIDPVTVGTGPSMSDVTVTNGGNTNSVGPNATAGLTLPGVGGVSFTSDFSGFMAWWAAFVGTQS